MRTMIPAAKAAVKGNTSPAGAEAARVAGGAKSSVPPTLSHRFGSFSLGAREARRAVPRVRIGPANDKYEKQAGRFADRIVQEMRTPRSVGGWSERVTPVISRPPVQRANPEGNGGGIASPRISQDLTSAQTGGSKVPMQLRLSAERVLGADLSRVRLHSGAVADRLNRRMGAGSFTTENHIFTGSKSAISGSASGVRLLAHELTHTVQQGGGAGPSFRRLVVQRGNGDSDEEDDKSKAPSGSSSSSGSQSSSAGGMIANPFQMPDMFASLRSTFAAGPRQSSVNSTIGPGAPNGAGGSSISSPASNVLPAHPSSASSSSSLSASVPAHSSSASSSSTASAAITTAGQARESLLASQPGI